MVAGENADQMVEVLGSYAEAGIEHRCSR